MSIYKRGGKWWYKFTWRGELIRRSTKQGNQSVARQMEAAHKTSLAKGEVGIRERVSVPTLREFIQGRFMPFVRSTFADEPKTLEYYDYGAKKLVSHDLLASRYLDTITAEHIAGFVAVQRAAKLAVSTINRQLQVLRRIFKLAGEWSVVERALPSVRMLPGERHRDRVLSPAELERYLRAASPLLRHVATILIDCGLRPDECFRLQWENVGQGFIEIPFGKTDNARRRIPITGSVEAVLEMRRGESQRGWVFCSKTRSGHIEKGTLKRAQRQACIGAGIDLFPLYTLRHTCLTLWAAHMDPWTLCYLAGHRDMTITKRYVHPQHDAVLRSMERAREAIQRPGGHNSGHSQKSGSPLDIAGKESIQ